MNHEFLILAASCALLSYFLDYCLGKPSSDTFNPNEIFSRYTIKMSESVMKFWGMWGNFVQQRSKALEGAHTAADRYRVIKNWERMQVQTAREYFTYHKALGMCPVCTNVWLTIGVSFIASFFMPLPLWQAVLTILLSNFLTRLFR